MKLSTRKIVISGILGAISILLGVTRLGFIPVPTPAGHATVMHIPVILGAVLEGPVVGLLTGAIFGLFSFLQPGAPFFADPLVSVLPRLFIGPVSFLVYASTKKINTVLACILAGAFGSATNTVLVLG
ncbi:MAG TPA: ECF transporter S component, partial [Candidatus Limnocylindrales bacterium]|nr:ECF transporter S component [Candidatus Limnocylindrales bacterium]